MRRKIEGGRSSDYKLLPVYRNIRMEVDRHPFVPETYNLKNVPLVLMSAD